MVGAAGGLRHPRAQVAGPVDCPACGGGCHRVRVAPAVGVGAGVAGAVPSRGPRNWRRRRQARGTARGGLRGRGRANRGDRRIWSIRAAHRGSGRSVREALGAAWTVHVVCGVGAVSFFVYVFGGLRAEFGGACARMSPCFVGQRPGSRTAKPSLR